MAKNPKSSFFGGKTFFRLRGQMSVANWHGFETKKVAIRRILCDATNTIGSWCFVFVKICLWNRLQIAIKPSWRPRTEHAVSTFPRHLNACSHKLWTPTCRKKTKEKLNHAPFSNWQTCSVVGYAKQINYLWAREKGYPRLRAISFNFPLQSKGIDTTHGRIKGLLLGDASRFYLWLGIWMFM